MGRQGAVERRSLLPWDESQFVFHPFEKSVRIYILQLPVLISLLLQETRTLPQQLGSLFLKLAALSVWSFSVLFGSLSRQVTLLHCVDLHHKPGVEALSHPHC